MFCSSDLEVVAFHNPRCSIKMKSFATLLTLATSHFLMVKQSMVRTIDCEDCPILSIDRFAELEQRAGFT